MIEKPHGMSRNQRLLIAAVVVLIAAGCSMVWVDRPVAEAVHGIDKPTRAFIEPVTALGESYWWLVPAALLTGYWSYRRSWALANRALYVFCSVAAGGLLVHVFKFIFGRARPKLYFRDGVYGFDFFSLGFDYDYTSFPSGHSTVAGALVASLWLVGPAWLRWPALGLTLLIAASRVALTSHWVSDVLAGYLLGVCFAVLVHWRFMRRGFLDEPAGLLRRRRV